MGKLRKFLKAVFERSKWKVWALFALYLWSLFFFSLFRPELPTQVEFFLITPQWWVVITLFIIFIPGSVFLPIFLDPEESVSTKHFLSPLKFIFWVIPVIGQVIVVIQIFFWLSTWFKKLKKIVRQVRDIISSPFISFFNFVGLITVALINLYISIVPILWITLVLASISIILSVNSILKWVFNPLRTYEILQNGIIIFLREMYRYTIADSISKLKHNPEDTDPNFTFNGLKIIYNTFAGGVENFEKPNYHQRLVFKGFFFTFLGNVILSVFAFSLIYMSINGIFPGFHFAGVEGSVFATTWSQFLRYSLMIMTTGSTNLEAVSVSTRLINVSEVLIGLTFLVIVVTNVSSITTQEAERDLEDIYEDVREKKNSLEEEIASLANTYILHQNVNFPDSEFRETIKTIGKFDLDCENCDFWNKLVECCNAFEKLDEETKEEISERFDSLSKKEKLEKIKDIKKGNVLS